LFKKILLAFLFILILLYVLAAVSFQLMSKIIFPQNPEKRFRAAGIIPGTIGFTYNGMTLKGVSAGADSLPLVVFVHGSPGSWMDFLHNLTDTSLVSKVHLIAVDRIGYGQSSRKTVTSLQTHAAVFAEMLRSEYPGRKAIWAGHSYGGPIVARVAMDFPDVVSGLVIIAGSIDPKLEKKMWYNEVASWKVIQWNLPEIIITSNKEIMPLKKELAAMQPLWENITVPVIIIQGMKDALVPYENADFAKRALVNVKQLDIQMLPNQGHLIPWQKPDVIKNAILKFSTLPPP